jgi:predicted nucleic acid-binding protein
VIVLDTSALVDSLSGLRRSLPELRRKLDRGERILLPALVLYEWRRGPRKRDEIAWQEDLFPNELALPFGPREAAVSAELYRAVSRARTREVDLAIAAHAIVGNAELWTLNIGDFKDIPGLRLAQA